MEKMSSIEMALNNERAEMKYYLEQARRSKNYVAKRLFEMLAYDEKEHMERIRDLHAKLTADGSWPTDVPINLRGTDIKDQINFLMGLKESATEHDDDDIAALQKGAETEARGAEFYKKLAELCTNPQEKKFFTFLSSIENEHYMSIKSSIFYLQDPEGWMEANGRVSIDGA